MVTSSFDVVIVGSGFAGLTAGALLAQKGVRVGLFERHDKVGGFASHFRRKGFKFEVAIHLIEGRGSANFRDQIFETLGLWDLPWIRSEEFFRIHFSREWIAVPTGFQKAEQHLQTLFPKEAHSLNQFFRDLQAVMKEFYRFQTAPHLFGLRNPLFSISFPNLARLLRVSLADYLRSLFKEERLIWTLMANIGFYHHDPLSYPAALYLAAQSLYFDGGAYYLEGGSQSLSDHLANIIKSSGGEVILRHEVLSATSDTSGACTVIVKPYGTEETIKVQAQALILNAAADEGQRILGRNKQLPAKPGFSASTLFLGMNPGFLQQSPLGYFNFVANLQDHTERVGHSPLEFSLANYGILSESLAKKPTLDLIYLDPWEAWNLPSEEYEVRKTQTMDRLFRRLDLLQPGLTGFVEVAELGTPKTIHRYTKNTRGAAYGFDPLTVGLEEFFDRRWMGYQPVDEHLKNVFYASAWSSFHGITGTTVAGYQAAQAVMTLLENQKNPS